MSILINNVSKRFANFQALDRVSLEVPHGTLLALLGPSGSGKTTLLRIIAGLEVADSGSVHYHDEEITHHSARDRKIGFVFEHYALFRHMSVADNIGFGLRMRGVPKAEIKKRVQELVQLIRLDGLEQRYPGQLSGGQRQRVALARALAARPGVLLLDEPFGALDAKVRLELRAWLRKLHEEIHVTSVFVTHDQDEAFEVADHVVVMNHGRIEQVGTPDQVFDHPANPFVMDFLGNLKVFHGRVESGRVFLRELEVEYPAYPHERSQAARVYVRPHEWDISSHKNGSASLQATVLHVSQAGSVTKVKLSLGDDSELISIELSPALHLELGLKPGDQVGSSVYECETRQIRLIRQQTIHGGSGRKGWPLPGKTAGFAVFGSHFVALINGRAIRSSSSHGEFVYLPKLKTIVCECDVTDSSEVAAIQQI